MKILYIITLPDIGGAQVHLHEVISKLPNNITPYIIIGKQGWLSESLKSITENIYIIPSLVREMSLLNDLKAIYDIKNIMVSIQPDIVHCHSSKAGFVGRVAAKFLGIPSIFTAHGWAFTEGVYAKKRWVYKNVEKAMAKWTEKIICVSDYDRKLALNVMPEDKDKLITIHNGIRNSKMSQTIEHDDNYLNIVMIARFAPQKDQALLIDAIDELNKVNININLTLVGDGPNYNKVKEAVMSKRCSEKVHFLGSRLDIDNILASNDIFALISNWEGFPISILEAMRQGLPVVASDVGGVCEAVMDGETGFLIPKADKISLKEKLTTLYKDRKKAKEMGLNGRKRFVDKFTSDYMMEKIIKEYEKIN